MVRIVDCLVDQHDYRLVALAIVICLFACYTALSLFARAQSIDTPSRYLWLLGTAVVSGSGVWTTHFVSMLAFTSGLPTAYDLAGTAASITVAVVLGGFAFLIALDVSRLVGGALFGLGVAGMHYVGMQAFEAPADMHWDVQYVTASIAIGIILGMCALKAATHLNDVIRRLAAALLLSAAIGGMHFTAMAALSLEPNPTIVVSDAVIAKEWIALATASVMLLVIGLSFIGAVVDQHLTERNTAESEWLREHVMTLEATQRELEARTREVTLALEAAAAGSQAKSQFLATMSHELRTPLNAIIGFSEMLKHELFGPLGDPRYRDYADSIHGSGHHLLGLINDVLDFSKLEAGRFELQESAIDIRKTIVEALRMVEAQARKTDVDVASELPEMLPLLRLDERRLRQVMLNLLWNAVKFTPPGGCVTVSVAIEEDTVAIRVVDTGIGMSEEDIPKALDRFGQIDSSLSRRYDGTGLGLPLSKRLVELHGGTLDIVSAVGKGTTVTVRLPGARITVTPAEPAADGEQGTAAGLPRTASA
ncbi:MAG TPA: MHYT domain-containing protein [Alphaproteobacteria bacterium]|nr:MHYT domain-containing protein [Alphaproteobacteria bacterium]